MKKTKKKATTEKEAPAANAAPVGISDAEAMRLLNREALNVTSCQRVVTVQPGHAVPERVTLAVLLNRPVQLTTGMRAQLFQISTDVPVDLCDAQRLLLKQYVVAAACTDNVAQLRTVILPDPPQGRWLEPEFVLVRLIADALERQVLSEFLMTNLEKELRRRRGTRAAPKRAARASTGKPHKASAKSKATADGASPSRLRLAV